MSTSKAGDITNATQNLSLWQDRLATTQLLCPQHVAQVKAARLRVPGCFFFFFFSWATEGREPCIIDPDVVPLEVFEGGRGWVGGFWQAWNIYVCT